MTWTIDISDLRQVPLIDLKKEKKKDALSLYLLSAELLSSFSLGAKGYWIE